MKLIINIQYLISQIISYFDFPHRPKPQYSWCLTFLEPPIELEGFKKCHASHLKGFQIGWNSQTYCNSALLCFGSCVFICWFLHLHMSLILSAYAAYISTCRLFGETRTKIENQHEKNGRLKTYLSAQRFLCSRKDASYCLVRIWKSEKKRIWTSQYHPNVRSVKLNVYRRGLFLK